jgi:hypothetical protein
MTLFEPWRRGALALLAAAAFCCGAAQAQTPIAKEEFTRIAKKIIGPISIVDAVTVQCDAEAPQHREGRQAALKKWRVTNRIDEFQTAIVPIFARVPNSVVVMKAVGDKAAEQVKVLIQKTPEICEKFDELLREEIVVVGGLVAEVMPMLTAANSRLAAATPTQRPPSSTMDLKLYTVVQLGNLAEITMNPIASAEAAAMDSKLADARRQAGNNAMEALGIIAVRGTVTGNDLHEWRGDEQSVYEVSCRDFVDKIAEKRFKNHEGKEITIGGKVANFVTFRSGGGAVILKGCGFLDDDARMTRSSLPESGAMEMRPPNAEEAYAGPGKGIQMGDVERVAYKVRSGLSRDGFGNMYQERNEDTWILLKDGTAYHYHWRFPFTDLNVVLVKRRDAYSWSRWREEGKDLVLTKTSGKRAGEAQKIESPSRIMPFPPDTRFERRFKFLHVGAMGIRSERDYIFRRDGTVDIHGFSMVAAQLGPGANISASGPGVAYSGGANSSLIVAGKPNERRVRYKIDGYLLELTADDGAVDRHFIARMNDGSPPDAPKLLYLNGQMLWENDKGDND